MFDSIWGHQNKMTRLQLEQEILGCWCVVDDLNTIANSIKSNELTSTEAGETLNGVATLLDIKFNKLFETFETLLREKKL